MTVKSYENMAYFKEIVESGKHKTARSILQC